ncbi:hypothetical protein Droror1_Dr00005838 [Drosera rotundifolia]
MYSSHFFFPAAAAHPSPESNKHGNHDHHRIYGHPPSPSPPDSPSSAADISFAGNESAPGKPSKRAALDTKAPSSGNEEAEHGMMSRREILFLTRRAANGRRGEALGRTRRGATQCRAEDGSLLGPRMPNSL